MKIWVHINGVQEGPYDLNTLPLDRMTPDTPVWYEGLKYWVPACNAQLTAPLVNNPNMGGRVIEDVEVEEEPQTHSAYTRTTQDYGAHYARQQAQAPEQEYDNQKCPSTYLAWSIIMTVLCCNPIGIIPIVLGSTVNSRFRNYDFDGARKASEQTAWWVMITIVTSIMLIPFSMLMML